MEKNYVILLAGGTGTRFGSELPKQFIEVDGIPIIIYTLRRLQTKLIDAIVIVCKKEWMQFLNSLLLKFNIKKVISIVEGGKTGFESIQHGFDAIANFIKQEDIVVIHDSVRPLLPEKILSDSISTAIKNGNGCAALKNIEGLVIKDNDLSGSIPADRYKIMRIQTPQSFRAGLLEKLIKRARDEGKKDIAYTDDLLIKYGVPIFFSRSFSGNTKITTRPDLAFFKAMLSFSDDELIGDIYINHDIRQDK